MADQVNKTVLVSADTKKAQVVIGNLAKSLEDLSTAGTNKETLVKQMEKDAKSVLQTVRTLSAEVNGLSGGGSGGLTGLVRGATGFGGRGNDARDFSRQAQGLGGLVHVYAAVAANVYATSEAFNALSKAMDVVIMKQSMDLFAASTGVNVRTLTDEVMRLTDAALKLPDATRLVNLGVGAGIAGEQLKQLAVIAKGASAALGRDLNDSMDRLVRGIAKIEPELLDELGITIRAGQAYEMYAKSIGAAADELTGYQRMQAYTNAVIGQGLEKFEAIAEQVEVNAFTKLAAQIKNTTDAALGFVGKGLTPMINGLLEIPGAVQGLMALAAVKLAQLAMPALTSFKENALKEAQDLADKTEKIRLTAETATNSMIASQRSLSESKLATITKLANEGIKENAEDLITHTNRLLGSRDKLAKQITQEVSLTEGLIGKEQLRASLLEKAQTRHLAALDRAAKLQSEGVTSSAALTKALQQEKSALNLLNTLERLNKSEQELTKTKAEHLALETNIAQLQTGGLNKAQQLTALEAQRKQALAEQKATLLAIGDTYGRMSKQAKDYYSYMQLTAAAYAKERQALTESSLGAVTVFNRSLSERVTAASTAITAIATTAKGAMSSIGNFVLGPWGALIGIAAVAFEPLARWAGLINEFSDEVTSAQENLERFGKSSAIYLDKVSAALANTTRGSEKFGQIVDQVSKNVDSMTDAINRQFEAMEKYKKEYEGSNWFQQLFMAKPENLDVRGIAEGFLDIFEKIKATGLGKTGATGILAEALGIKATSQGLLDLRKDIENLNRAYLDTLKAKSVALSSTPAEKEAAKSELDRLTALQKQIQSLPDLADKLKEAQRASVALLVDVEKSTQAIGKALDNADNFAPILESNLKKLQDPVNTLTEDARQMIGVINQFDRTKSASALEAMLVNVNRLTEQTIPGVTELISHLSESQAFQVAESGKDYGQEALDRINAQVLATNELMKSIAAADQRLKDMKSDNRSPLKFIENAEQNLSSLIEQLKLLLAGTYGVATGALAGASSTKDTFPKPPKEKTGKSALDIELELKRSSLELDRQAATLLKDRIDLNAKIGITSEAQLYTQYEQASLSRNQRDYELDILEIQKKAKDMPASAAANYKKVATEQAKSTLELKNQQVVLQAQELAAQNMYNAAKNRLAAESDVLRILDESYALQSKFGIGDSRLIVQNKVAQELNKLEAQRLASYEKIDTIQLQIGSTTSTISKEALERLKTEERLVAVTEDQMRLVKELLPLSLAYELSSERASKAITTINDALSLMEKGYGNLLNTQEAILATEYKSVQAITDRIALIEKDESLSNVEKQLQIQTLINSELERRVIIADKEARIRSKFGDTSNFGSDVAAILAAERQKFFEGYQGLSVRVAQGMTSAIDNTVDKVIDAIATGETLSVDQLAGVIGDAVRDAGADYLKETAKLWLRDLFGFGNPVEMQKVSLLGQIAMNTAASAGKSFSPTSSSGFNIPGMSFLGDIGSIISGGSTMLSYGASMMGLGSATSQGAMLAAQTGSFGMQGAALTGQALGATSTAGSIMGSMSSALAAAGPYIAAALLVDQLTGGAISTGIMGGARGERTRALNIGIANGQVSDASNIYRATHYDAGWGRSGSWNVDNLGGAEFNNTIKATVNAMATSIKDNAARLGFAFNEGFSGQFDADLFGKTAEETQQIIADTFKRIGQEMVESTEGLSEALAKFQQGSETSYEALSRLMTQFDTFNYPIGRLNDSLATLNLTTLGAVDSLVSMAGGLQNLQALQSSFIDTFYTDAQKAEITTQTVSSLFATLNAEIPNTRESLVSLVQALDLTTESGRNAYISLTSSAAVLSDYYRNLEQAHDAAARAAQEAVDAAARAVDTAKTNLSRAIDAEKQRLQQQLNADIAALQKDHDDRVKLLQDESNTLSDNISKLKTFKESLDDMLESLVPKYSGRTALSRATTDIMSYVARGVIPEQEAVQEALDVVKSQDKTYYATYEEYALDQARANVAAKELLTLIDSGIANQEATLQTVTDQIENEGLALAQAMAKAQATYELELARLDSILESYGILNNSVLSVRDAILELNSALAQKQSIDQSYLAQKLAELQAKGKTEYQTIDQVAGAFAYNGLTPQEHYEKYGKAEGLLYGATANVPSTTASISSRDAQYYAEKLAQLQATGKTEYQTIEQVQGAFFAAGLTPEEHYRLYGKNEGLSGYANGGYTGDLPTDAVAGVVHGQEYVINAPTAKDLGINHGNGGVFKDMLSELNALRNEIAQLREQDRQIGVQIIKQTRNTANSLDRWEGAGLPPTRV